MTVVLGIRCADGLVMAADTQVTDSARGMSYPATKLHRLGDYGAWGGSGARSVLLDLENDFEGNAVRIAKSGEVAHTLQQLTVPVLRHHYDNYIPDVPGEEAGGTPSAYVLVGGYVHEAPFLIEINPSGMVSNYEDVGFHAIGSGAPMAHQAGTLLAHFRMTERSVDYGVVAAHRVLQALAVTSPSVGGEYDIARITAEGAHYLDDDEVAAVGEQVERWIDLEQRALDELFD